jgi:polynucleotide 5'-kinase involved in rRNA processing
MLFLKPVNKDTTTCKLLTDSRFWKARKVKTDRIVVNIGSEGRTDFDPDVIKICRHLRYHPFVIPVDTLRTDSPPQAEKVIVVGDYHVGKTSLVKRFTEGICAYYMFSSYR